MKNDILASTRLPATAAGAQAADVVVQETAPTVRATTVSTTRT